MHHAQLDAVAIGVGDVNLERAIGPHATFVVPLAQRLQVGFPRVHIVNQQREMIALGMRMHGLIAFANQMQFLRGAELIPSAGEIKGEKYTILDTRTDGFDFGKAKAQAQDAVAKYDDLGCMVGLFAYNPPLMLDAVREAGKVGKIKIVAFDEHDQSLQGIKDKEIYGTVVQNPYKYGYESVRVLAGLAKGDESVIPEDKILYIPARQIRNDNVDAFQAELQRLLASEDPVEEGAATSQKPGAESP